MNKMGMNIIKILKKISLFGDKKRFSLSRPYYLLIGTAESGKTNLLKAAGLESIAKGGRIDPLKPSLKPTKWWKLPQTALTVLEVPGDYLNEWIPLLNFLKKEQKKIAGIIVSVSVAELLKNTEMTHLPQGLDLLSQCVKDFLSCCSHPIHCQVVVTQSDLIPGFTEFFAELSQNESYTPLGFSLSTAPARDLVYDVFSKKFNRMLKKINHQLIATLHQETNSAVKYLIKDFPLAFEKLKEPLFSFIKDLPWQSVYFTSALQVEKDKPLLLASDISTQQLKIYQIVNPITRPYFIRQLFTKDLAHQFAALFPNKNLFEWKKLLVYIAPCSMIVIMTLFYLQDFIHSQEEMRTIEDSIRHYQQAVLHTHESYPRLLALEVLLGTLEKHSHTPATLFVIYTKQAEQKINIIYTQSLKTLLLPEIKNYLENYLKGAANKNVDAVYAVLKAYLILGENKYVDPQYFINVFMSILPNKMQVADKNKLARHLQFAFKVNQLLPLSLNPHVIKEARAFLSALTGFQLGYLILKNMNIDQLSINNYLEVIDPCHDVFTLTQQQNIPYLFTGRVFNQVLLQTTKIAAEEAIIGNGVLGDEFKTNTSPDIIFSLAEQLQVVYINHYIKIWETMLQQIQLLPGQNLQAIDRIIFKIINKSSPLLTFLKIIHENTNFAPIIKNSVPLQQIAAVSTSSLLADIFSLLSNLHQELQAILLAENSQQAAFEKMAAIIIDQPENDILVKIDLLAERSPPPIKDWLLEIANNTRAVLINEASFYIDSDWRNHLQAVSLMSFATKYQRKLTMKEQLFNVKNRNHSL